MLPAVPAIATSNLTKRFGHLAALDGIDLVVPAGVTYGFLGPNGAGKTTAIRILTGFLRPTSGEARLWGHDSWRDGVRARADLGYLVPADALYPDMSGIAQLDYLAALTRKPPVLRATLLDALELSQDALKRRLQTYSKGMKQKLALTAALQSNPALLILDEPTDGLDPLIQHAFEQILCDLRRQGTTIFMSSHDLSEVERICERVAIIREGRIVADETIEDLKRRYRRIAEITFRDSTLPNLEQLPGVEHVERDGQRLTLSLTGSPVPLLRSLAARGDVADVLLPPPRLEDIFFGFYRPGTEAVTDAAGAALSDDSEPVEVARR
jgi:ABC-2 type transport system ATP-binding protein